jgi:hypothetical protein
MRARRVTRVVIGASLASLVVALASCACSEDASERAAEAPASAGDRAVAALPPEATAEDRARARLDADFPKHGVVTGVIETIHVEPNASATVVGWLRVGATVRLSDEARRGEGCDGRWRRVHPTGWVCDDDDLAVADGAPTVEAPTDEGWKDGQVEEAASRGAIVAPPPGRDEPLPYDYYYVKEPTVPEYHRLPSRNEQRAALAKAERYRELLGVDERRARLYLSGEREDGPPGTAVVSRYLDRGFYVASNGREVRASRVFVRTTQGRYIKQAQLETRTGHDFRGVELGEGRDLPVAWTVRAARPLILDADALADEPDVDPIERQTALDGWRERRRVGGDLVHVIETERGERFLRLWLVSVAERIARPEGVADDEPWVHVDLSEQTLVLYRGDAPIYTTLVSTGVEGHETPIGMFEIRRKHVTDTMSNLGSDAGDDRYSIEDVPWTEYFEGSVALHTAFWHTGFGIPRSHGCVNMTPFDAHRVFRDTWPALPEGWHGVSTEGTPLRGSHVIVTE